MHAVLGLCSCGWKNPRGQAVHFLPPTALYLPLAQGVQLTEPLKLDVPGEQGAQRPEGGTVPTVPSRQDVKMQVPSSLPPPLLLHTILDPLGTSTKALPPPRTMVPFLVLLHRAARAAS